jgi:hypothetical protein
MRREQWDAIRDLTWFRGLQAEVTEHVDELHKVIDGIRAVFPRCHWPNCSNIGVKWIARHVLYCDEHGSPFLQDAPWAEFVRKEGL